MFDYIVRLAKRAIVLVPGLAVTYFAVLDLYPLIDRRLPAALAILLTYVVTAYLLIPGALRLTRIFHKTKHIPLYCITPDGFASDPVNVGVVGTMRQLEQAMTAAGWHEADARTPKNLFRMATAIIFRRPYPSAPFSTLYLFGRRQDIGFQLPLSEDPTHRHHVRFWAVRAVEDPNHHEHVRFWQKYHVSSSKERVLWVGAASLDVGIAFIRHNAQLTHFVHPDTNAERTLIIDQLKKTGQVTETRTITIGKPYQLRNRVWSGHFKADGTMVIAELKTK